MPLSNDNEIRHNRIGVYIEAPRLFKHALSCLFSGWNELDVVDLPKASIVVQVETENGGECGVSHLTGSIIVSRARSSRVGEHSSIRVNYHHSSSCLLKAIEQMAQECDGV